MLPFQLKLWQIHPQAFHSYCSASYLCILKSHCDKSDWTQSCLVQDSSLLICELKEFAEVRYEQDTGTDWHGLAPPYLPIRGQCNAHAEGYTGTCTCLLPLHLPRVPHQNNNASNRSWNYSHEPYSFDLLWILLGFPSCQFSQAARK